MRTVVELPDALYEEGSALAAMRGATLADVIRQALERELAGDRCDAPAMAAPVELPVLRSRRPGTLDLSEFNFDDLLA